MNDNFVFFYGGPFSQWYKCNIIVCGKTYNCAEQYFMAQKALFFMDIDMHAKIMAAKEPKQQKAFGRQVKNFDAEKWNKVARKFCYEANLAKFSNPKLGQLLLDTGDKEIVEASPRDVIWGIGLGENDADRFDKSKWRGTNWLGEVLMEVREELRKEND